jgi:sugar phosphate permease
MGLMKAILYGFLLWMPTYLAHIHLAAYKSIIPIIFNAGTLLGSFLLGHLYEDID